MMTKLIEEVRELSQKELERANQNFPLFNSLHEGYAVIQEEIEEMQDEADEACRAADYLWRRIKNGLSGKDTMEIADRLYERAILCACEAIQTAAMARKFIDSA